MKKARKLKRGGRPPLPEHDRKQQVTLRLDPEVLAHYRAKGRGWQTHINSDLRRLVALDEPKRQPRDRATEDSTE
jgi:uncharacterized protein (DUF4415 family)